MCGELTHTTVQRQATNSVFRSLYLYIYIYVCVLMDQLHKSPEQRVTYWSKYSDDILVNSISWSIAKNYSSARTVWALIRHGSAPEMEGTFLTPTMIRIHTHLIYLDLGSTWQEDSQGLRTMDFKALFRTQRESLLIWSLLIELGSCSRSHFLVVVEQEHVNHWPGK